MIPQSFLEKVRKGVDIVVVIAEYVELVKAGNQYKSCCPFPDHEDSTPSFYVNPHLGIYKCYGCNKGGNVFTFIQAFENVTFVESVKHCCKLAGIDYPFDDDPTNTGYSERIYQLCAEAAKISYLNLHREENAPGLKFLKDSKKDGGRGIEEKILTRFGVGFGDNLGKLKESYEEEILDNSGLFNHSDEGTLDSKFYNRYTFPITTLSGKVISFGGYKPKSQTKYLNGGDSIVYHKEEALFGLPQAKKRIKETDSVVIAEGYFDVLTCHQFGFTNTIGLCGCALTPSHAKLLKRMANTAILFLDNDSAGKKATPGAFATLWNAGFDNISVVQYENKQKDPDDYLQYFPAMEAYNENGDTVPVLDLITTLSFIDLVAPKEGANVSEATLAVRKIASLIENPDRRRLFVSFCANNLGVREVVLWTDKTTHKLTPRAEKVNTTQLMAVAAFFNKNTTDPDREELTKLVPEEFWPVLDKRGTISEIASLFDGLDTAQASFVAKAIPLFDSGMTGKQVLDLVRKEDLAKKTREALDRIHKAEKEKDGEGIIDASKEYAKLLEERCRI